MNHSTSIMKSTVAVLVVGLVGASAVFGADLTGKVKLNGTPKPEVTIDLGPSCSKLSPGPATTRHYVVGADKGLANVFVYVKEGAKATPATEEGPLLDQVGCMYAPYVMGVVTGQKFKIRNSDTELHNVHATPKINKEFNFGQPTRGMVSEKSFDTKEVLVRMKCDVHPWMFAYVGVCEHPYFAVTDKDGNFTIKGLPAGKYTVEAFHLKAGAKTQEVSVGDGAPKPLEFTLDVPAP